MKIKIIYKLLKRKVKEIRQTEKTYTMMQKAKFKGRMKKVNKVI
jgi:hypothetical protein